jgi:hypothetical protein
MTVRMRIRGVRTRDEDPFVWHRAHGKIGTRHVHGADFGPAARQISTSQHVRFGRERPRQLCAGGCEAAASEQHIAVRQHAGARPGHCTGERLYLVLRRCACLTVLAGA